MALFLETQAISNELLRLIKEAKERLILVSPYLKASTHIQERLNTISKKGILSEFLIIYGKEELKKSEQDWIKEIENLEVIEKKNLHAKCYINEEKAIICSMNLYDFSQQNNIEMGILITKKDDEEAYNSLMDEISNLKINGTIKKFVKQLTFNDLDHHQKLKFRLIEEWRIQKAKGKKAIAEKIVTEGEMLELAGLKIYDLKSISGVLSKEKYEEYGERILNKIQYASSFTIGEIQNVLPKGIGNQYVKIQIKLLNGEEKQCQTTIHELPKKGKYVGVRINDKWFNEYLYLDEPVIFIPF